jgi:hypothetical protein
MSSMRELSSKAAELFRKNPVLWLPFFCAHLLTSCLVWVRKFATHEILAWIMTKRSVLGGNLGRSDLHSDTIQTIERISFSMQWGTIYVDSCLNAIALVLTAVLLGMIVRSQRPSLATAFAALRYYPERILFYSLKFWLLSVVLDALMAWPASHLLETMPNRIKWILLALTDGQVLLTMLCSAWVMAPIAIRLLRPVDSGIVSAEDKRKGRYFYMLTVAAMFTLSRILFPLVTRLPFNATYERAIVDLASFVVSFLSVLLFIALALLAASDPDRCQTMVFDDEFGIVNDPGRELRRIPSS